MKAAIDSPSGPKPLGYQYANTIDLPTSYRTEYTDVKDSP